MPAASGDTLPDLLQPGLAVVFVGINPSVYSVERGRYFARPGNRFWPCLSRSALSAPIRAGLGISELGPANDRDLLAYGIGFTDVAKRAKPKASDLRPGELAAGVDALHRKIERFAPRIVCFHGVTGYRVVHDRLADASAAPLLGLQTLRIGATRVLVVPNPSGANAHFTREQQTAWYDALAAAAHSDDSRS